jgi:hypothetical protein
MQGRLSSTLRTPKLGASGLATGLRAFFCVCLLLLPLYGVGEPQEPRSPGVGMEASPPPLLEASSRLAAGGGLERRLGVPAAPGSVWTVAVRWSRAAHLNSAQPDLPRAPRAAFGRWQLEGG